MAVTVNRSIVLYDGVTRNGDPRLALGFTERP